MFHGVSVEFTQDNALISILEQNDFQIYRCNAIKGTCQLVNRNDIKQDDPTDESIYYRCSYNGPVSPPQRVLDVLKTIANSPAQNIIKKILVDVH